MCLAKNVVALCGKTIISWNEFILASGRIALKGKLLLRWFELDRVKPITTTMLSCDKSMPEGLDRIEILIRTLSRGRTFQAADARDHIYAFLSHPGAMWGNRLVVQPDFTKTAREVYIEFALQILAHNGNLSPLVHAGNRVEIRPNSDIPSWVPEWYTRVVWHYIPEKKCAAAGREESRDIIHRNGVLSIRGIGFDVVLEKTDTWLELNSASHMPYSEGFMTNLIDAEVYCQVAVAISGTRRV